MAKVHNGEVILFRFCIEGSYKSCSCCLSVLPTYNQFTLLYLLLGK